MLIRLIDIAVSLIGLVFLGLIYPLLALLIKLDSRGPVFYKCKRVGRNSEIFDMYKFRTMYETPRALGPSVSPEGDPRVTTVGRVLRRLKLNEFPQFINVFLGEMTLVGPRPEAPDLAALYPKSAQKIFSVKPGLIGPNQILGRNEEEMYPPGVDPQKYYIEEILPQKLPLDLEYIADRSLLKNLKFLFQGVLVTITGAIGRRHLWDNRTQLMLFVLDIIFCLVSFSLAHFLRFDGIQTQKELAAFYSILPWAVMVRLPIFISFGFYHVLIRHLSLVDLKRVFQGVALASLAFVTIVYLTGLTLEYARGVFLIDWFCLTTFLTGYRALAKKIYLRYKAQPLDGAQKKQVLIWGAGDCGELCLRFMRKETQTSYEVIGFIDDNPKKRSKRLGGIKVLGDRHHLKTISELYKVKEVVIAVANTSVHELQRMFKLCRAADLKPQVFFIKAEIKGEEFSPALDRRTVMPANGYVLPHVGEQRIS
jgi:lipopolysaccharide/colanic/teichoic acid biosynthesis glycosyltransferase